MVIALTAFTVYGFGKLDPNYMDPASLMPGGWLGLLRATAQLTFATGGAQVVANLSGEAKNPTKDIPKVMILSTLAVAILYALMSTIAAGVDVYKRQAYSSNNYYYFNIKNSTS